jgi:hypothetical protein
MSAGQAAQANATKEMPDDPRLVPGELRSLAAPPSIRQTGLTEAFREPRHVFRPTKGKAAANIG